MMAEHITDCAQSQRRAGQVAPVADGKIEADRKQIVAFANAVFKRCAGMDGWVALRAFEHATDKPVLTDWVRFDGGLIDRVHAAATRIGQRSGSAAAVFSPPACLFKSNENAKAVNVAAGPVISVELDERPTHCAASLEAILGKPTLIVASGGVWTASDSTKHDKLHLYWRLKAPATTPEELAELNLARKLATAIVGADATNNPVSHPIRWPGSFHTKIETPRMCRIIGGDPDREISLVDALALLKVAAGPLAEQSGRNGTEDRVGFKTPRAWTEETLLEVGRLLPNTDKRWPEWSKTGMAFFDASHGSPEGLEAFHLYSEKSDKYDPARTGERWDHWHDYPPSDLSGGTLKYRMQKEVDPMWLPTAPPNDALAEPLITFAEEKGPLDIFREADPAQLSNLPANAVPPKLERWIKSEARRKGAPEAFAAISALTVIGSAIGADIRVQVRQHDDTWTEAANLWSVIVADPGNAKSPVISAAAAPLRAVDARWVKEDQARFDQWQADKAKARRSKDLPDPGKEPRIRRAMVDDVTSEKQIRIFRDNPRGVLQIPDELAGLLGAFGAYKQGGGSDRAHFLRSFDGGNITADRVGSGTISAERASLSVLAGTQPDKLREVVKGLGSDGLLQRFLVVLHDGRERKALDEAPDREAGAWYSELIGRLTSAGYVFPDPVRLSPEAGAVLAAADEQIKALKHFPGAPTELKGHLEKWGRLLPRLILITHVVRQMDEGEGFDPTEMIEPATAQMAVRLASFFLDHAIAFYVDYFGSTKSASEARWIAGHLLTRPDMTVVTRRDIYDHRKPLRGQDGNRVLLAAMRELEEFGWCWAKDRDESGPTSWCIDQRIHERFAERADRELRERSEKHQKIVEAGKARALLREGFEAPILASEGVFG
ncbi:MAG: hypothetical protein CML24_14545 [Rhizobiales bacterium]|nr:hypothetical protein [Hyphomicrobiales bacterium]